MRWKQGGRPEEGRPFFFLEREHRPSRERSDRSQACSPHAISRGMTRFTLILAVLLWVAPAHAGYTHYWRWRTPPARLAVEAAIADMRRVVHARSTLVQVVDRREEDPWADAGVAYPTFVFEGKPGQSVETFGFPLAPFTAHEPSFQFVKTRQMAYDEVVAACLIVASQHFPRQTLEISSDGAWETDWRPGRKLYEEVFTVPALSMLAHSGVDPLAAIADSERESLRYAVGEKFNELEKRKEQGESPHAVRRNLLLSATIIGLMLGIAALVSRKVRK